MNDGLSTLTRRTFLRASLPALGALSLGTRLKCAPLAPTQSGILFDGKTLDGWRLPELPPDHDYRGGRWRVVDGSIQGEQFPVGDKRGSALLTDRAYADFDLTLDIWPDWGCDSGLFLRATPQAIGFQIMIDYLPGGTVGFIHGQGLGFFSSSIELQPTQDGTGVVARDVYDAVKQDGLVYAASAVEWNAAWRWNTWNTMRVRCVGRLPDITTWINGVTICEMRSAQFRPRSLGDAKAGKLSAPSAYDAEKVAARLGSRGHIALQVHPGRRWADRGLTRFRNITLREL